MFDLYTSVLDPEYNEELDEERLQAYIHEVMAEFEQSAEGEAFMSKFDISLGWPASYMDYAAQYFGATLATVTPGETAEILFDIFPRKVSVESERAQEIVAELRAFWQFLKRTRALKTADAILQMLTDEDADRLEADLADPSNFGMAKSFFMTGMNAGFDMTHQADLNRFLIAYNMSLLAGSASDEAKPRSTPRRQPPATLRRPVTIQRESRRVGRNEPCPCGSGRKYKKCCLR